ncbi:MAG: ATP-binding protein [Lachnospiraceae bacterium]|nr:ATP-binding protein [Lachnospiraceae bacterium]
MALTNSQYDAIMRDFDRRRNAHILEATLRKREILNTLPRVREIEDEISLSFKDAALKRIHGDKNASADFEVIRKKLEEEKAQILRQNGYDMDYSAPHFDCPLCNDTGYVGSEKCRCLKSAIISYLYELSRIKDRLLVENFDTLNMDYYSKERQVIKGRTEYENMELIVNASKDFVKKFHTDHKNLFFTGNVGCGKTFLTNCIAKELIEQGVPVVYLPSSEFFAELNKRRLMDGGVNSDTSYIDECELLIIDDLGTELTNERMNSDLFTVLNSRINNSLSTIISTNFSLPSIKERYSERVYSRLYGSFEFYQFFGDDIRKKRKNH